MATEAIAGFKSMVYISQTEDGTYNRLCELKEVTLSIERDTIDVSNHCSGGWKDNINGMAQWSASAEALYIFDNTAQEDVWDALIDENPLWFRFVPRGSEGVVGTHYKYEGQGIITSWELSGPNDDAAAISIEILGVGQLDRAVLEAGDNP